jgi:hypothetical protein
MNMMRQNWKMDGRPWRRDGMRQPQVLGIRNVPKVVHAATIEPRYQDEL